MELMPHLRSEGGLRCLVRGADELPKELHPLVVEADLGDYDSLASALEGIETAYYLVHSMERGSDGEFAERDRKAAENFARAATEAGLSRTIYMGGVGGDDESEHIESRREVEGLLEDASPDFVALRASMIVGAGSASFGTLVRIVSRLPVLALPEWRDRRTQPIAIADIVDCLLKARTIEPGIYEVAGPDTLTFGEMTEAISDLLGKTHRSFPLPFSNAKLEAAAASVVTGGERELLEPLMEGLHGDLLVEDNKVEEVFGVEPTPFNDAARDAIDGMSDESTPA